MDPLVNNSNAVMADLAAGPLPAIVERHGVEWGLGGGQEQQSRIAGDMALGAVLGLALIYLVLAFVFASYGWPLVVMSVIPFGLIGAIFGHWLLASTSPSCRCSGCSAWPASWSTIRSS